jgi:ATP-dependent DNA helicase RecG
MIKAEHMTEQPLPKPWIDEEASKQLSVLCAQGEGQFLEYMREFPKNARDLAKEIAAFATSNAGIILIGVDDDGTCRGISAVIAKERDDLYRRLEGICTHGVKPSITPVAKFACQGEHLVLMLWVPKGSQPIYYAHDVPYVRHITSSRPAQPHEVIELIQGFVRPLHSPAAAESVEELPGRHTQLLADLLRELASVEILGEELQNRAFDPWLELMRAQFGHVASRLREAAAEQAAVDMKLDLPLLDAAEAFDHFAQLRLHLGSGEDLSGSAKRAVEIAKALLERIAPEVISHVSPEQLTEQLLVIRRELAILADQADKAPQSGSMERLQSQATEMGGKILNIAQYGVNRLAPNLRSTLLSAGHQLHISETEQMYLDGGASVARIVDSIKRAIDLFNGATEMMLPRE